MILAKQHLDIGLQTNRKTEMLDFWQGRIESPFEELLAIGGGMQQHRHSLNGSVLKINHSLHELDRFSPTGYRGILIAKQNQKEVEQLTDPDGNSITLIPPGTWGVHRIGIKMLVSSLRVFEQFYKNTLGLEQLLPNAYRWGTTVILLEEDPSVHRTDSMAGVGFRYITVQITNVDKVHDSLVSRGATEGRPPITLGNTARISFIRDPDGNWIEISQRASLTGSLD